MWGYLEHINTLLRGIVRVMSNLPKAQVLSVKVNNNTELRRRTVRKTDIAAEHEKIVTSHCNIPYVTNVNGELIPGLLVYVMEGILPLIKVRLFTG